MGCGALVGLVEWVEEPEALGAESEEGRGEASEAQSEKTRHDAVECPRRVEWHIFGFVVVVIVRAFLFVAGAGAGAGALLLQLFRILTHFECWRSRVRDVQPV